MKSVTSATSSRFDRTHERLNLVPCGETSLMVSIFSKDFYPDCLPPSSCANVGHLYFPRRAFTDLIHTTKIFKYITTVLLF